MAPGVLAANITAVAGVKATSLVTGDDFPSDGASWPARIGSTLAAYSSGRPSVGSLAGRRAPVFAQGPATVDGAQAYALPVSQAEYWGVAIYTGSLPIGSAYPAIVGGAGSGPRLMGSQGTSEMLFSGTITRDGVSTLSLNNLIHVWRVTGTPSADQRLIGAYATGANNWVGSIGLVMAFATALTAGEASQILTLVNRYFKI
jgi:hypothetical protein